MTIDEKKARALFDMARGHSELGVGYKDADFELFKKDLDTDSKFQEDFRDDLVTAKLLSESIDIDTFRRGLKTSQPSQPPAVSLAPPQRQSIEQQAAGQATGFVPPMQAMPMQATGQPQTGQIIELTGEPQTGEFRAEIVNGKKVYMPQGITAGGEEFIDEGTDVSKDPTGQYQSTGVLIDDRGQTLNEELQNIVTGTPKDKQGLAYQNAQNVKNDAKSTWQRLKETGSGLLTSAKTQADAAMGFLDTVLNPMSFIPGASKPVSQGGFGGETNLAKGAKKEFIRTALDGEKELNNKIQELGLQTDIVDAVKSGRGSDIIQAINHNIGQMAYQVPLSISTFGASSFAMEGAEAYKGIVDAQAKELGITADELIERGLDKQALGIGVGAISGAVDYLGAKSLASFINAGGAYEQLAKAIASKLPKKYGTGFVTRAAVASNAEGFQESIQEGVKLGGERIASGKWDPNALNRLGKSYANAAVGAGGTYVGGRTVNAALNPSESITLNTFNNAPVIGQAPQQGGFDAVILADQINQGKKVDIQSALSADAYLDSEIQRQGENVSPELLEHKKTISEFIDKENEFAPRRQARKDVLPDGSVLYFVGSEAEVPEEFKDRAKPSTSTRDGKPVGSFSFTLTPEEDAAYQQGVPPPSGADQTTYETVSPEELQAFRQGQIDPERAAAIADDVALIQSGQMDINSIDDPNYRLMVESAMGAGRQGVDGGGVTNAIDTSAIEAKLDQLRQRFIDNGKSESEADQLALNAISDQERQLLRDAYNEGRKNKTTQNVSLENKVKETESKIKNKGLFLAEVDENGNRVVDKETGRQSQSVGEIISQSDDAPVPTSVREINGIEFVEFSNPRTGDVDVIVTGKNDGSYVGYYRLYDNGKPTNQWSSKFENPSRNKEDFKTMISGVQSMLPEGHEYTEKTSISTDGLRVWEQQLGRGYELQTDENGNILTNEVAINGDAINNELGVDVDKGGFSDIEITPQQFESVKKALLPYLKKLGLNESNIRIQERKVEETGRKYNTVVIDLPVLKKKNANATPQSETIVADQAAQNMGTAVNQPLETGAAAVEVGESGRPVVEVEGDQVVEEEGVEVTPFKKGDGHTLGTFEDKQGKLYKSLQPTEARQNKEGVYERMPIENKQTDEYNILKELQGNPHIPKIGKIVQTSSGPAFEIERLDEVENLSIDEYRQVRKILDDLNDKEYHVGDKVTIMRRPKTNELVVVDFSAGYKGNRMSRDTEYLQNVEKLLSKKDQDNITTAQQAISTKLLAETLVEPDNQYYLTQRPPSIGTHPVDGFVSMEEETIDGRKMWKMQYDRPLSKEEIESYELKPVLSPSKYATKLLRHKKFNVVFHVKDINGPIVTLQNYKDGKSTEEQMSTKTLLSKIENGDYEQIDPEEFIDPKSETPKPKTKTQQITDLRAKEQAEYDAMSDPNDQKKRDEIFDRYDKLISPLLGEKAPKAETPKAGSVGVGVVKPILSKNIDIKSSEGRKGLVPISELEEFIGEDRLGEAQMTTSRATIDRLKEDISKNGFKEPILIVYDKFSGDGEATIIEGNHRIIAAKELGLTEIPVRFEKGTIRDNESRVKDKMFPIKRKTVGKLNDTRGIKGSDLGLTVRQPTEADFVKAVEQSLKETPKPKAEKTSPLAPFSTKDKEGQAARAALKESVGPKEFKRLENIAKNGEKILRDLESRQILKIDCP